MENEVTIQTVKEQRNENNELIGYLVDGTKSVPLAEGNRDYQEVLVWIAEGGVVDPEFTDEELAQQEVSKLKPAIARAIETMRVEVDGLAYDGNEPSQARMDRAIQTLVGDEPITWRMYDNSTETLTQTELGKALRAAGVMQTKLWFCSSVEEVETLVGADTEWYAKYSGGEA